MLMALVYLLAVILIAAFFGWLTRRAWGARRAWIKWPGVIFAGLLTLVAVLAFGGAASTYFRVYMPRSNKAPDIQVAGTPEQIARGQKLANMCKGCHTENQTFPLTGSNLLEGGGPPVGLLYAKNLTPYGLDEWTDGEIIRAIREGIHKSGRSLLGMPSKSLQHLSDEDVQALVAFLRSQPSVEFETPEPQINLLGALMLSMADLFSARAPIEGVVTAPPEGATLEYGEYLIKIVACSDCHGENLAGGLGGLGPPVGPNLTQIVPNWAEEDFVRLIRTGIDRDGKPVSDDMPWYEYNDLASDDDLKAMYLYLHSLKELPTNPTK